MRQRRSEQLGSLSANNDGLKVENQQLQHQIAQIAGQNRDLVAENAQLKEELLALKQQMMTIKNPVGPPHETGSSWFQNICIFACHWVRVSGMLASGHRGYKLHLVFFQRLG